MCQSRGKKTDHSFRKSTATDLTVAGLPPHKVIRISGHKNVSIQDNDTELTNKEHRQISNIMCGGSRSSRLIHNRSASSVSQTFSCTRSTSVSITSHTITRSTEEYGEEHEQMCRPTSTSSDLDNQNQDKPSTFTSTISSISGIPSLSGATFNHCVLNFNFK